MDLLVKGLLKLSRLGRAAFEIGPLDMNKMLRSIQHSMQHQINKSGVEITVEDLPMCVGDSSQINQVFTNLLDKGDLLWYHKSFKRIFMECVMPIFEYKCAMCGAVSEFLESAGSRKKHVCEKCDGTDMKKMLSSFSPMVKQRATGGKCSSCPEAKCPYSG